MRAVNPCEKARLVEFTRTCTDDSRLSETSEPSTVARVLLALPTADFKHAQTKRERSMPPHESVTTSSRRRPQAERRWLLSRTHRNPTGSTQRMDPTLSADGRSVHTFISRTHSVTRPHQQCSASLCPRAASHCLPSAPMSGGSSSDWWEMTGTSGSSLSASQLLLN